MNPYIVKALIEVSLFLEFADSEIVDPDAAVAAMEQMAANLQRVDNLQKLALTARIQSLASDYPEQMEFVRDLPETFGLR